MASRDDVIREVMSMVGAKYQHAKAILKLSAETPGTFRKVGASGKKRSMSQAEASRIVEAARKRIALVDED